MKSRSSDRIRIDEKQKNRLFWAAFVILSGFFLFFLIYGSVVKQFWYDEMAMVGFVCGDTTIPDLLHTYLTDEASNLPLYALLLWPIYHFLPAHEGCLLLLSVALTFGAGLFLALFTRKRYGNVPALVLLVMYSCSTTVRNRIGMELRAYSLMFFGCSMALFLLLLLHEKRTAYRYVYTELALFALVFSHYFGVLMFAMLGAGAVLMVAVKKEKASYLIPFGAAGALFVPWFVLTRITTEVSSDNFWIPRPKLTDVPEAVGYLLGGSILLCGVFGLAWILVLYGVVKKKRWLSVESFILLAPVAVLGGIFVYSRFLSRGGGLFENRYFIAVLPMILLTIPIAIREYADLCKEKKILWLIPAVLLVPALYQDIYRAHYDTICQIHDASASAEYIIAQGDAENADVRIVALSYDAIGDYCTYGWGDFYIRRQGGIQKEIYYTRDSVMDDLFARYAAEGVRRIYVMADKDFLDYFGTEYERVELEDTTRLTVFEYH